jgi:hypothetical protein
VIQPSVDGGTSKQRLGTSRDVFCYGDGVFPLCDGRQETLNEALRRAMLRARLREVDVATRLGVDPKTVRRWLSGRVPYPASRATLANLVGVDEADLWPEAGGLLAGRSRPEELAGIYPQRWAVPRDVWAHFFESAEYEIGILAYSALFLAEDAGLLGIIEHKALNGVRVRFLLGSPDSPSVALRGKEEGIGDAMAAKVRNALTHYQPMARSDNVEIRLHDAVLYNSIYRADDQLFVNQHAYGMPAAHSPVLRFSGPGRSRMVATYLDSFEKVWNETEPHHRQR